MCKGCRFAAQIGPVRCCKHPMGLAMALHGVIAASVVWRLGCGGAWR